MVHFTCDLCGKDLTTSTDGRFVVKIEAYPGFDPTEIREDDLAGGSDGSCLRRYSSAMKR